jgi:hypothetical protein
MRLIIQRVINASVVVGGKTVSKIDKGLLVLVGIQKNDTVKDSEFLYVIYTFLPSTVDNVIQKPTPPPAGGQF